MRVFAACRSAVGAVGVAVGWPKALLLPCTPNQELKETAQMDWGDG